MPHHIELLHFDDELDSVDWFPRALFEACHVKYAGLVTASPIIEYRSEHEMSHTFDIKDNPTRGEVKIVYRLVADETRFQECLSATTTPNVCRIVLLDLIRENHNGTLEPGGVALWRQLQELYHVEPSKILFVTAYPQFLKECLDYDSLESSQIIAKPATAARLTAILIAHIEALRSATPQGHAMPANGTQLDQGTDGAAI